MGKLAFRPRFYKPEVISSAVADYLAGVPGPAVAAKYGIAYVGTIHEWVRRSGGAVRPVYKDRAYSLNESAFKTLTDDSAYWVGFLLADGSVNEDRGTVTLSLALKDRPHVEAFGRFLGSSRPVKMTNKGCAVYLHTTSRKLVDDLIALGVTGRKSHTAAPPPGLVNSTPFWRGVIDGDGCLRWSRGRHPHIGLVGSRVVCSGFSDFVSKVIPGYSPSVRPHKNIWGVQVGHSRHAAAVAVLLYASGPALSRKATLAAEFGKWLSATPAKVFFDWDSVKGPDLIAAFHRLGTWAAVANELGVTLPMLNTRKVSRFGITSRGPTKTVEYARPRR